LTSRDRQIDRLAKLLALAGSSNAHEAAAARQQADRLMKKHGLSEADVAARDAGYCEVPLRGLGEDWRLALATAAARRRGAEVVFGGSGRGRRVRLCGERADVARSRELFEILLGHVRALEREAADAYAGAIDLLGRDALDLLDDEVLSCGARACSDSFRRGVVLGVVELLDGRAPESPSPEARSAGPAGKPGMVSRALERVVSLVGWSRGGRASERTRTRHKISERSADLRGAGSDLWHVYGRFLARKRLEVGPGDEVRLRTRGGD
jgi:hypothetical protein